MQRRMFRSWLVLIASSVFASSPRYPIEFDNFVGLDEALLRAELVRRIPSFDGLLAERDPLLGQVLAVLQTALQQRGVSPRIESTVAESLSGGDQLVHRFRLTGPDRMLCRIQFTGVEAQLASQLTQAVRRVIDQPYSRAALAHELQQGALPRLRGLRYLQAEFFEPQLTKSTRTGCAGYDAAIAVALGASFRAARPIWRGNQAISSAALDALLPTDLDTLIAPDRLSSLLAEVRTLYGTKGYADAQFKLDRQLDLTANTQQLTISILEGPVFRVDRFAIQGLDDPLRQRLEKEFPLAAGDQYDAAALERYQLYLAGQVKLARGPESGRVFLQVLKQPHHDRKLIDITIVVSSK
jgi:outer membrane protein assembly factor BamA